MKTKYPRLQKLEADRKRREEELAKELTKKLQRSEEYAATLHSQVAAKARQVEVLSAYLTQPIVEYINDHISGEFTKLAMMKIDDAIENATGVDMVTFQIPRRMVQYLDPNDKIYNIVSYYKHHIADNMSIRAFSEMDFETTFTYKTIQIDIPRLSFRHIVV